MKHTICYTSKASKDLNRASVELIYATTQQNNTKKGITGILLYGMDTFFQVLEGEKDTILRLYETIKTDPRHHTIYEVMNRPAEDYIFSSYSSVFKVVNNSDELEDIRTYLAKHEYTSTTDKLKRLLKPFILDL